MLLENKKIRFTVQVSFLTRENFVQKFYQYEGNFRESSVLHRAFLKFST